MKRKLCAAISFFLSVAGYMAQAADYATYLTPQRGFTEVTSLEQITGGADLCYILASAEKSDLIVGIGAYEAKPDWAGSDTKALRYRQVQADPVLDRSNFFTIERSDNYVGLRNLVYDTDLMQTHENAGYMYVNTFTDKTLDEWSQLTPTYQPGGYWLFESGKYPMSSGNWACGFLGPWNNRVEAGEPIALNRRNTAGDEAGHYRLFRISRTDLAALRLYTSILTSENGFTEVTDDKGLVADPSQCYLITSAEQPALFVGMGKYESKPAWAGEDTRALRYRQSGNPLTDLSNFFTIERNGRYIGLRNVVEYNSLFQTHQDAGFMYVLTNTEPTMSNWTGLIPLWNEAGYWTLENGMYPMSGDAYYKGFLGPWYNRVAADEPIAANRSNAPGDEAGHFRLWRISRIDLLSLMQTVGQDDAADVTWKITNPSFENGETGWTLQGKDPEGNNEFAARDYGMTGREGSSLLNAFQWWASSLSVSQTVKGLPAGQYELSATVASWAGRTISMTANAERTMLTGVHADGGIRIKTPVTIGTEGQLIITAGSTTDWWTEGRPNLENETQCFFKIDDVRLECNSLFLDACAVPLPNDATSLLVPGQWYYYETDYSTEYQLIGPLDDLVYTTDGNAPLRQVSTIEATRTITLPVGRAYFKTVASDATLSVMPYREVEEGSFTAVALNVDGLPNKIATFNLNPDGPGRDGTLKISKYLSSKDYDLIGCSEDFNYNGALMESLNDRYLCGTIRNTLNVGDIDYLQLIQGKIHVDTDGLNLIWKTGKVTATNESWTKWDSTEATDGNQYVNKGYRHYDLWLSPTAVIDVYILHMDAGDTNATWSREAQWRQLADAINASDHGRAKLIIGDTNSRYTRENVIGNFIQRLSTDFTMNDVWVELYRNGVFPTTDMANLTDQSVPDNYSNYEIVDKIIYINPTAANTVRLTPQAFSIQHDYTYGYVDGTEDITPLGDHHPTVATFSWKLSAGPSPAPITLMDNADNTTVLSNAEGAVANVTLQGRTLHKDGLWNTLCLPFDATLTGPLAGATLMTLESSTFADGTLTLNFANASTIEASKPYIIKWAEGTDVENPVFSQVTVSSMLPTAEETKYADFIGSYSPANIYAVEHTNLYLASDNVLCYPTTEDYRLNAFRSYFRLKGLSAGNMESLSRAVVLNFGQESDPSAISMPSAATSEADEWFTLDGRRLSRKPAARGIYINKDKKVHIY